MDSIQEKWTALLTDASSRRFMQLSLQFLVLLTFSCYVEEWIFKALPGFEFANTVALVELLAFALWACVERWAKEGRRAVCRQGQAPVWAYALLAVCLAASQSLGKITLFYMNYATGTVVKSAKLVPTLAMSSLWFGRQVQMLEWAAAALLVTSSACMALGEQLADVNFKAFGLVVAALQLVAAALQGNLQEHILKDCGASISDAMIFSNTFGAVIVFFVMVFTDEIRPATYYFVNSPLAILLLLIRSVAFLLGALALNVLTKEYGTGAATAVGAARKSLTLLFSFALFPKPFHVNYILGVLAFLSADGIYLHVSGQRAQQCLKLKVASAQRASASLEGGEEGC